MKETTRRNFMMGGVSALGTLAVGCSSTAVPSISKRGVKFGVLTDSHYSERDRWSDRHYRDSLPKMRQAINEFNRDGLDFAIELGDMKDMGTKPDRRETLRYLNDIEAEFSRFNGPRYHVLGNHDMDCITKDDFLSHTMNHGEAKGKTHYSFTVGGVKFVVLDACFNQDRTPYRCGNFNWTKAFIPDEEMAWFDEELKVLANPVVVFCHQLLDGFSATKGFRDVFVGNWKQAVDVMERRGNVLAVIQGHHHSGNYSSRSGIHYWTVKGMISGAYPPHNSYAEVEVFPDGGITVKGFGDCESRFFAAANASQLLLTRM